MLRRVVACWVALAVTLTTATQLRPNDAPIGPGELLLVGWIGFVLLLSLRGVSFDYTNVCKVLTAYWLLSGVLLAFGALVALSMARVAARDTIHDAVAFLLVALFVVSFSTGWGDSLIGEFHHSAARAVFFLISICSGTLFALSLIAPGIGPVELWYESVRFRGWAENPNQMALAVVGMPFLGWYLLKQTRGIARAAYVIAAAGSAVAALATASDGLRVAWIGAALSVAVYAWYRSARWGKGKGLFVSLVLVPVLIGILCLGAGQEFLNALDKRTEAMYYAEGDQGGTRVTIWLHGLQAIAQSPFVGFGPGSYSGFLGPFGNLEAHNSFIDWGMSTGGIGIVSYAALLIWAGTRLIRTRSVALLGMLLTLILFSMFNYVLRQPIYWMMIVLVLRLSERRSLSKAPAVMVGRTRLTKRVALTSATSPG